MACNSCSAAIGAASSIDLLCWLGGAASGSCQYRTKIYRPCVCSARPNACLTRDVSVGAPITVIKLASCLRTKSMDALLTRLDDRPRITALESDHW
ncbi:hypothetical protein PF005_g14514 [Phytophthora fragariae]|uniref:Uncharacterized protein n=2 Tax=Phytophthora TaxID=4783 RepID=A0A6A3SIS9_9STRA|nr:hypothetical protein PF003_g1672 [Phytophthora fragariae]KAE8953161.1 hypothetical protein PR001_g32989 [Phytophthora rubi]KAE8940111.1 hypothetical protein PF009_g10068 [Phytophthora fragariae]KAE9013758.1 hypothetical protein PF011_g8347 [Phytophthora fragariae]KAE9116996.1 hypothetical protein PF010_g8755 [Phytophthora fragariae]